MALVAEPSHKVRSCLSNPFFMCTGFTLSAPCAKDLIGYVNRCSSERQTTVERRLNEHLYDLFLSQTNVQRSVDVAAQRALPP